jgi:hypothetical protein
MPFGDKICTKEPSTHSLKLINFQRIAAFQTIPGFGNRWISSSDAHWTPLLESEESQSPQRLLLHFDREHNTTECIVPFPDVRQSISATLMVIKYETFTTK